MLETYPIEQRARRLLIRLSSLGDVILATSALEVFAARGEKVDWLVAAEYADLIRGHEAVGRVWEFKRGSGLTGWWRVGRVLWAEGYSEIFDLHGSLRSRLLRIWFFIWSARASRAPGARWSSLSKRRMRLWGLYLFKAFWPGSWAPGSQAERFARAVGGTGIERPRLSHLVPSQVMDRPRAPYICVMPGSRWPGKRWPVERYVEALAGAVNGAQVVVMGSASDHESEVLTRALRQKGVNVVTGVGRWGLREVASVLAGSAAYVGNDTGLAHLAEAVGTRAGVVFGPTVERMGFGPWRQDSRAIGAKLGCRPCGKDGRFCYRLWDRYGCLARVQTTTVRQFALEALSKAP